jgi:hypothetical protein
MKRLDFSIEFKLAGFDVPEEPLLEGLLSGLSVTTKFEGG